MGEKYIENTGTNAVFVGGKLIPPGEGRHINEAFLPPEHQSDKPAASPEPSAGEMRVAGLAELLGGTVKEVSAALAGLTLESLELLGEMEASAINPRKSLLAAVQAEQLKRASAAMDDGGQAEFEAAVGAEYQKQLAALTDEQRAAIGADADAHKALRDQAELDVLADMDAAAGKGN